MATSTIKKVTPANIGAYTQAETDAAIAQSMAIADINVTPANGVTLLRFSGKRYGKIAVFLFIIDLTEEKSIYDELLTMSNVASISIQFYHLFHGVTYADLGIGFYIDDDKIHLMGSQSTGRIMGSGMFMIR